jgi:putative toxin-antitoxin system antitoxin component (TIGR02293 family)
MGFENFHSLADRRLTGKPLNSETDVMAAVQARLPSGVLSFVKSLGVTQDEIASLIIKQEEPQPAERLTVDQSDRVVRVLRLIADASDVFGDRAKAFVWLRRPLRELNDQSPLAAAETDAGARVVQTILAQIAWGAAA